MSIAVKYLDLRRITHVAPQEKWMTMCDVSVTGFELGSKLSPVEVTECPHEPLATFREAATSCPRVVGYMAGCSFQECPEGWVLCFHVHSCVLGT